jgi:hypothetical protein
MELRLQQFIESVETLADIRNLDEFNPIIFQLEHPVTATRYTIVGAKVAPSYLGIPVNTTWIVLDPQSVYYRMALKLVDTNDTERTTTLPAVNLEADINGDGSIDGNDLLYWNIVRTYDEIFVDPQYYVTGGMGPKGDKGDKGDPGVVDYNVALGILASLTGSISIDGPDVAMSGETSQYRVYLTEPEVLPDGTITDPVTSQVNAAMILTGPVPAGTYIDVNGLLHVGSLAEDTVIGIYATYPSFSRSVAVQKPITLRKTSASVTGVSMSGPNNINSGSTGQFALTATWSDGTTTTPSGVWSLNSPDFGTLDQTGLLTVPSTIAGSGSVNVSAEVVISGVTYTPNKTVTITKQVVVPTVTSVVINGPSALDSEVATTGQYSVTVNWSDSTTTTPTASWSLNTTAFGTISSSGLFTVPSTISSSGTAVITATVNVGGNSYTPTKSVAVTKVEVAPTVTSVTISGASSVNNGSSTVYSLSVMWSNGSTTAPAADSWTLNTEDFGTISIAGMLSVDPDITVGGALTITANITIDGTAYSPTKNVTVNVVDTSVLMPRYGTGVALPADFSAFVNSLTSYDPPLTVDGKYQLSVDILGSTTYLWFAYPASHGEATFYDKLSAFFGGFGGAGATGAGPSAESSAQFKDVGILRDIDIGGTTVQYYLYRTDWPNLGTAAQNQYEVTLTNP